jgi:hypothetical protein
MLIEKLIQDNPQFHFYQGRFTSWAVHPDTLRFLCNLLTPGMSTLETGCGQTTVVFSLAGANHICVTPNSGEAERVKQYCAELGLTKNITFLLESSDVVLPKSELIPSGLDHVFIDGAHGFPAPVIDWHYTASKLKLGGILGVDDFKMPSVRILYDFLCAEEEWELIKVMYNTAFFRKLQEPKSLVHWSGNKMNQLYQGDRLITTHSKTGFLRNLIPSRLLNRTRINRM